MTIEIIRGAMPRARLAVVAAGQFGDMVQAVVDVERHGDAWLEFDSMINVRPSQGNRSRGVEDERYFPRFAVLARARR
jgi:hypothetical protein